MNDNNSKPTGYTIFYAIGLLSFIGFFVLGYFLGLEVKEHHNMIMLMMLIPWLGLMGAILPTSFLRTPNIWSMIEGLGVKSIRQFRGFSIFFLIATLIVLVMFAVVGDK